MTDLQRIVDYGPGWESLLMVLWWCLMVAVLLGVALKLPRWLARVNRPLGHCQAGMVAKIVVDPAEQAANAVAIFNHANSSTAGASFGMGITRPGVHTKFAPLNATRDAWILSQSALSLAKAIRLGQLTSRECCEAQVRWARVVNKDMNAVANWRSSQAFIEADKADGVIKAARSRLGPEHPLDDELGPFFGVGCSIKECIGITGMPQTAGLVARAEGDAGFSSSSFAPVQGSAALPADDDCTSGPVLASCDATVVSRLRFHADAVAPTPLLGSTSSTTTTTTTTTIGQGGMPKAMEVAQFGSPGSAWMLSSTGSQVVSEPATVVDVQTASLSSMNGSIAGFTAEGDLVAASIATALLETANEDDAEADLFRLIGGGSAIDAVAAEGGDAGAIETSAKTLKSPSSSSLSSSSVGSVKAAVLPSGTGAGLIPLWNTNLSELCMWYESSNAVYGRSNNPYDLSRGVGGSSGGEGAMVSVAASPVGVGSDVGGSIRMPAAFNGVFGHKPTGGLIPNTGQYPYSTSRILATGPLTRYASDLWPMLCAMAGHDMDKDAACRGVPLSVFGLIGTSAILRHVAPSTPPGLALLQSRDARPLTFESGFAHQHTRRVSLPRLVHVLRPVGSDSAPEPGEPWSRYDRRIADEATASDHKTSTSIDSDDNSDDDADEDKEEEEEEETAMRHRRRPRSSSSTRLTARHRPMRPSTAELRGGLSRAIGSDVQVGKTESLRSGAAWERYSRLRKPVVALPFNLTGTGTDATEWRDVTVYIVPQVVSAPPMLSSACGYGPDGMLAAQASAAIALCKRLGCKGPVSLPVPELPKAFDMWSAALQEEGPTPFATFLANGRPHRSSQLPALANLLAKLACLPCAICGSSRRMIDASAADTPPSSSSTEATTRAVSASTHRCVGRRELCQCGRYTIPALGLGAIEHIPAQLAPEAQKAAAIAVVALRKRMTDVMSESPGILLFPPHPVAAPPHGAPIAEFFNTTFTSLFNALTLPVTSVPITLIPSANETVLSAVQEGYVGLDADARGRALVAAADACVPTTALPLGVQLVTAPGQDRLTIAAAEALDRMVVTMHDEEDDSLKGVCAARFGWRPPPACIDAGIGPALEGLNANAFDGVRDD